MKMHHSPSHWIMVALVLAALLLTLSEAHGQSGAAAVFEGRPAMSGAQGGQGAQAGVPQGGLGVQGNEVAERSMQLRKPSGLDEVRQARREGEADSATAAANTDTTLRKDVAPARDKSLAKDQRSTKKAVRGVKRSISRARHGNSPVDAGK
ncbi:MAG: hypothetical protein Q8R69_25870 [Telluria sp.]|nr:hypothetical protein [Telluria sp.]